MSQGTILHIFGWDKKFVPPFRDLVHEHFGDGRHQFVIFGDVERDALPASADTVIYPRLYNNLFPLARSMRQAEKIVLHSLFNDDLLYCLALQPWLLKKCYWVIWGKDLYFHEAGQKDWRWKKTEFLRRFVIKRLGHIVALVGGDYELAMTWYGALAKHHKCIMYTSNVYNDFPVKPTPHRTVNIQIGNSADPGNNHLDVFERLMPYRDQDVKIYAPLSYGDKDQAAMVTQAGKHIFGEKFIPLTEFMAFDQYLKFLGEIDIAIFNHKRQQALGNIINLLGLGKKVYLRRDITSWAFFSELGLEIFDVNKIDLTPLGYDEKRKNYNIVKEYFSEANLVKGLCEVFNE